jgi:hypothetical protein
MKSKSKNQKKKLQVIEKNLTNTKCKLEYKNK